MHLADAIVVLVCDVKVASAIHRDTGRIIQTNIGGHKALAGIAIISIPRHGGNDAVGSHFANALVVLVRDVKVASAIHRDSGRMIETRIRGGTAIAGITSCSIVNISIPRHGGNDAVGSHLADAVIVCDVKVARTVHRDAGRSSKTRTRGCAAIP